MFSTWHFIVSFESLAPSHVIIRPVYVCVQLTLPCLQRWLMCECGQLRPAILCQIKNCFYRWFRCKWKARARCLNSREMTEPHTHSTFASSPPYSLFAFLRWIPSGYFLPPSCRAFKWPLAQLKGLSPSTPTAPPHRVSSGSWFTSSF